MREWCLTVLVGLLYAAALVLGVHALIAGSRSVDEPMAATIFGTVQCDDGAKRLVAIEFYRDGRMRWVPAEQTRGQ